MADRNSDSGAASQQEARQPSDNNNNIEDSADLFNKLRSRIVTFVTVIIGFTLIVLMLDILILVQSHRQKESSTIRFFHILSIISDSICLLFVMIEWNCLYFNRNAMLKVLMYATISTYIFLLVAKIAQFSSKGGISLQIEEMTDVLSAIVILVVGVLKSKYVHRYITEGIKALTADLTSSMLSQDDYVRTLRNYTE